MAIVIPDLTIIGKFKVPPTAGEIHLLKFLKDHLDDNYEVYFNPYMNADRPDIVILRENYGVFIIEVKDFELSSYNLDEVYFTGFDDVVSADKQRNTRKKVVWTLTSNPRQKIKSPFAQVEKYKNNLYDIHIKDFLEKKTKNSLLYGIIQCGVYFHNATSAQLKDIKEKYSDDSLKYMTLISYEDLEYTLFKKLLRDNKIFSSYFYFKSELYKKFKRILAPARHLQNQGIRFNYSDIQKKIIYDTSLTSFRVKGIFGSGKTTVLAERAVQAYKRKKEELGDIFDQSTDIKVLILTFNITLCNYIRDKLNNVYENFTHNDFIIMNYHVFINSELNNLGIDISIPNNLSEDKLSHFLDENIYSNKELFLSKINEIKQYDIIFIDEIQDFKIEWMEIIKECFLKSDGEYAVFGDVKQNIYNNKLTEKDITTNVNEVIELKECYRSDSKINNLAIQFQKNIFKDKYIPDIPHELREKTGQVDYYFMNSEKPFSHLYEIIYGNMINKNNDISPNDITVLGCRVETMKNFDSYYRHASREKTNTMFESREILYLKYFEKTATSKKAKKEFWKSIRKELFPLIGHDFSRPIDEQIKVLFINLLCIYDLYIEYPEDFDEILKLECLKENIDYEAFMNFRAVDNKDKYDRIALEVNQLSDETIRRNKKFHFWLNSGTIKFSTIHSFKGWEAELVFLLLENNSDISKTFNELIYTGITRCRSRLFIINLGNKEYDERMSDLISSVNR